MRHLANPLSVLLLSLPIVACSAAGGDDPSASTDAAVKAAEAACSSAAYSKALGHYKAAVAGAKAHTRGDSCREEGATIYDIGVNAQRAVEACGSFRDVIKTSPYAKALRQSLADSLVYPTVTGALDPSTWSSLESALVGVKVHGPAPGAYGNVSALEFQAAGRGYLQLLNLPEDGTEPYSSRTDMRWSVEQRGGNTFVKIVLEYDNETEEPHELLLRTGDEAGMPGYFLELQNEPDASGALQRFDVYPSECDA